MPLPLTQPAEARTSVVGKPLSRHCAASSYGLACLEPRAIHDEEDRRSVGLDAPLVGRQVVPWVLSRPRRGRGGTSSSIEQMNAWRSMAAFDKTVLVRYLGQDPAGCGNRAHPQVRERRADALHPGFRHGRAGMGPALHFAWCETSRGRNARSSWVSSRTMADQLVANQARGRVETRSHQRRHREPGVGCRSDLQVRRWGGTP
jgi:hypothetical protein